MLLDPESRALLLEFMQENVWPKLGKEEERVKRLWGAFLTIWDVAPDGDAPPISAKTRARLEVHYEKDAEALHELGYLAPWLDSWR